MPSTAWPGEPSQALELTRLTRQAQDAKRFIALGAIEHTRLTRQAQDAKRFMALGAIEGN